MDASANTPGLPEQPTSAGELVVQNGRLSGTRQPLGDPLTLIGHAVGCDVRVGVEGVSPFHCLIVLGPDGVTLRDLNTDTGTRVNGQRVTMRRLRDGDRIEVGPFEFAVVLGAPPTAEAPTADRAILDNDREALQVQLAAVAAQQSALTEEESRLHLQAEALQKQEEQLAGHLQERQQRLDEQQEQLKQELTALQTERREGQANLDRRSQDIARLAAETATAHQEADLRRKRVADLRRKLVKRARNHWQAEEVKVKRREEEAARTLKSCEQERAAVRAFQERINGELELGRRQLAEEWHKLELTRKQWEESAAAERAERQRRDEELTQRAADIAQAEAELERLQHESAERQALLQREAQGLEVRITNQRGRLESLKREAEPNPPSSNRGPVIPPAPVRTYDAGSVLQEKRRLREAINKVGDQRTHLSDQWRRLLALQESWQAERTSALAELEATAEQLGRREQELASEENRLQRERERLERARGAWEGTQARAATQQVSLQAERNKSIADAEAREAEAAETLHQLNRIREEREKRWEEMTAEWTASRDRAEQTRLEHHQLRQECEEARQRLAKQEQALASKVLALERFRQESLKRAADSAHAETRLQRLEKREASRLANLGRQLDARREQMRVEATRLATLRTEIGRREAEAIKARADLEGRIAEWEVRQHVAAAEPRHLEVELHRLRAKQAIDERQLRQLREELERLVRSLIEEDEEMMPRAA